LLVNFFCGPEIEEDAAMKTPHFLNHSKLRASIFGVALACIAAPAMAAETWIACEGTVSTKVGKAAATTEPANDIYAYNAEAKTLYKYAPARKRLDLISTNRFDDKTIGWVNAGKGIGSQTTSWEGSIDRAKMSLKLVRESGDEVMTWTQSCKPTTEQPQS
jgi:hypothetical protein